MSKILEAAARTRANLGRFVVKLAETDVSQAIATPVCLGAAWSIIGLGLAGWEHHNLMAHGADVASAYYDMAMTTMPATLGDAVKALFNGQWPIGGEFFRGTGLSMAGAVLTAASIKLARGFVSIKRLADRLGHTLVQRGKDLDKLKAVAGDRLGQLGDRARQVGLRAGLDAATRVRQVSSAITQGAKSVQQVQAVPVAKSVAGNAAGYLTAGVGLLASGLTGFHQKLVRAQQGRQALAERVDPVMQGDSTLIQELDGLTVTELDAESVEQAQFDALVRSGEELPKEAVFTKEGEVECLTFFGEEARTVARLLLLNRGATEIVRSAESEGPISYMTDRVTENIMRTVEAFEESFDQDDVVERIRQRG